MFIRSSWTESSTWATSRRIDRSAVSGVYDKVSVRLCGFQLSLGAKQDSAAGTIKLACSCVACATSDRNCQVIHGYAASPHLRWISFDSDGGFRAVHGHSAHSRQNADPLTDLCAGIVVELATRDRVACKQRCT